MDRDTKLINLALDAGEIMIKNGAETFRVQDTMQRYRPCHSPAGDLTQRGKRAPFHDACHP